MRQRPLIGITGYHVAGEEGFGGTFRGAKGQGFSVIGHDYIEAVKRAGAIPVGIPVGELSACNDILEALDGVILAGGEDIDPLLYGANPDLRCGPLATERDRFELQLLEDSLRLGKPLLAICRGMQLLNVCFGGTLYIDISDHSEKVLAHQFARAPRWYLAHQVKLQAPSFRQLFNAEEIRTNSFHHQAVKQVGAGLEVAAVAEDGIVEGLSVSNHPNVLAVQWHPEMMALQYEEGLIPFRWLMEQINGGGA